MNGRVHPNYITWGIEQCGGLESDSGNHTMHHSRSYYPRPGVPAVRKLRQDTEADSDQSIFPGNISSTDHFPVISPVVTFTGSVVGSGRSCQGTLP